MTIESSPTRGSDPHSFATASILGALRALVAELAQSGHLDAARYCAALDTLQAQSATEVVSDADIKMTALVISTLKDAARAAELP